MKDHRQIVLVAGSSARRRWLSNLLRKKSSPEALRTFAGAGWPSSSAALAENPPDILVVDLESQEAASQMIRALQDFPGRPGAVALTDDPTPGWLEAALQAGVNAFISRNPGPEELDLAIAAAEAGLILLHPSSARGLTARSLPPSDLLHGVENLTAREAQVLRLIGQGLGNKEIAARLAISEHTAKFHTSSILGKLGVASRTEAVSQGIKRGLIPI